MTNATSGSRPFCALAARPLSKAHYRAMSKRSAEESIGEAEKKQFVEEQANGTAVHAIEEGAKAADAAAEKNADSKPTLYHILHYSSTRPLVVIKELGIGDKINIKEITAPELKTEEYLAMNPHGTVRIHFLVLSLQHSCEEDSIRYDILDTRTQSKP